MPARPRTPEPVEPLAYAVNEAAAALSVSRAHIYNLIKRGEIRSVQIGGVRRIPRAELLRLLELAA